MNISMKSILLGSAVIGMTVIGIGLPVAHAGDALSEAQSSVPQNQDIWRVSYNAPGGPMEQDLIINHNTSPLSGTFGQSVIKPIIDGDTLSFTMIRKTPMGAMNVEVSAQIDGESMRGTMRMVSGSMAGNAIAFSGTKVTK
ncbi:MAG: hypothetical protein COA84_07420 [Robiginitomaculum sp.]|nr:MAG: hypothetical protein COA84_07420 [Robiginitomaculum sp.]